jgi:hypothetical protein
MVRNMTRKFARFRVEEFERELQFSEIFTARVEKFFRLLATLLQRDAVGLIRLAYEQVLLHRPSEAP